MNISGTRQGRCRYYRSFPQKYHLYFRTKNMHQSRFKVSQTYYQLVLVSLWVAAMVLLFLRHPAFHRSLPSSSLSAGQHFSNACSKKELTSGLSSKWLRNPALFFNYCDWYLNPSTHLRDPSKCKQNDLCSLHLFPIAPALIFGPVTQNSCARV